MLLLYEYRSKKHSCITYYEPCLNEVFTSAMGLKYTPFFLCLWTSKLLVLHWTSPQSLIILTALL